MLELSLVIALVVVVFILMVVIMVKQNNKSKNELKSTKDILVEALAKVDTNVKHVGDKIEKGSGADEELKQQVDIVDTKVVDVDKSIRELEEKLKIEFDSRLKQNQEALESELRDSKEEIFRLQEKLNTELVDKSKETHDKIDAHSDRLSDASVKIDRLVINSDDKTDRHDNFANHVIKIKENVRQLDATTDEMNKLVAKRNDLEKERIKLVEAAQQIINASTEQMSALKPEYFEVVYDPIVDRDKKVVGTNVASGNDVDSKVRFSVRSDEQKKNLTLDDNLIFDNIGDNNVANVDTVNNNVDIDSDDTVNDNDAVNDDMDSVDDNSTILFDCNQDYVISDELDSDNIGLDVDVEDDEYNDTDSDNDTGVYVVRFYKDGGISGDDEVVATVGTVLTDIYIPHKQGYIFVGYFDRLRGEGKPYYDMHGHGCNEWDKDSDTSLFAYWIPRDDDKLDANKDSHVSHINHTNDELDNDDMDDNEQDEDDDIDSYDIYDEQDDEDVDGDEQYDEDEDELYEDDDDVDNDEQDEDDDIYDEDEEQEDVDSDTANQPDDEAVDSDNSSKHNDIADNSADTFSNKEISFLVRLDKQGGYSGSDWIQVDLYDNMDSIVAPRKPGCEFMGYYDKFDGRGKKYYDESGVGIAEWDKKFDTTLFAHWIIAPYHKVVKQNDKNIDEEIDSIFKMFNDIAPNYKN